MAKVITSSADNDTSLASDEMKATYKVRIGNMISVESTARITPAGVIAVGVTTLLVALAFTALARPRRRHWR
jgi:hypothetical protein